MVQCLTGSKTRGVHRQKLYFDIYAIFLVKAIEHLSMNSCMPSGFLQKSTSMLLQVAR